MIYLQDAAASYNFVKYINDPTPANPSKETHGTSCAGIIAMKKDIGKCGVGVAHQANIGGTRIILLNKCIKKIQEFVLT